MLARRLQILADGEEIDARGAQIVHHLHDLFAAFAQPHHQARFGEAVRHQFLGALEKPQRREIARAGPHRQIKPRHGFEIVVEDVGPRRHHDFDRAGLAQEIRRQHFDRRAGAHVADGANGLREMLRAAVGQIVAVDRGDHHMLEAELGDRLRPTRAGSSGVERVRADPVFTLQKAQARVQVSPMIIMVAWRWVQHSPIFGQPASSQTVCSPCSRTIAFVSAKFAADGRLDADPVGLALDGLSGRCAFSGWRSGPEVVAVLVENDGHGPYIEAVDRKITRFRRAFTGICGGLICRQSQEPRFAAL